MTSNANTPTDAGRPPRRPRYPKDPHLVELGRRVREHRRAHGWTQRDLGMRAAVNIGSIGHIEQGAQNPGLINLLKIARGLEIPAAKLVDGLPTELGLSPAPTEAGDGDAAPATNDPAGR